MSMKAALTRHFPEIILVSGLAFEGVLLLVEHRGGRISRSRGLQGAQGQPIWECGSKVL